MTGEAHHRVLVIDDDAALTRALAINLRARGWAVTSAADGYDGLAKAGSTHPDVVVVDLGLPAMSGLEVIARLRAKFTVPIVVLSARHLSGDKVVALDAGADDYVTKPFALDELLARLRAAVRRAEPALAAGPALVEAGDLAIDLQRKQVTRAKTPVRLTPTEWALLEVLVRNQGSLVTREQLLRDVWGPTYRQETNYLRVYTAQLRRKLEPDPAHPIYIITQPGMGYLFEVPKPPVSAHQANPASGPGAGQ